MAMKINTQCWLEIKPDIIPYQFSGKEAIIHHGGLKKMRTIAIKHSERSACISYEKREQYETTA